MGVHVSVDSSLTPSPKTTPCQPSVYLGTTRRHFIGWLGFLVLLIGIVGQQVHWDQAGNTSASRLASLRMLPRGDALRPVLLGYHHLGADLLWLRIVQVLGERTLTSEEYEWLYQAINVVTTLDPQYVYAYDAGGTVLAELGNRVDLSNRLLEKGMDNNPSVWRLPFVMGFNHFFHLQDYVKAGAYMAQAAQIPGRPLYVDTLAARLYVEGGSPALAMHYLEVMIQQATDPVLRAVYTERYKEVLIDRDVRALALAIQAYQQAKGERPGTLADLVSAGVLPAIPDEPFGGAYRYDVPTGVVTSSTHPERLRLYHPSDAARFRRAS